MSSLSLKIGCDAVITAIYSDELVDLMEQGTATVTRASHVEPNPSGSGWLADMSPVKGPTLGPFRTRQEALDAEVEWIKEHLF